MRIILENLGIIESADVKVDAITVIAGENSTGKSTLTKALYAVLNGCYNIPEKLNDEQHKLIQSALIRLLNREQFLRLTPSGVTDCAYYILNNIDSFKYFNKDRLQQEMSEVTRRFSGMIFKFDEKDLDYFGREIEEIANIDSEILCEILLNDKFSSEFNGQINNIYNDKEAIVKFNYKDDNINFIIKDNEVESLSLPNDFTLSWRTILLDDPFIADGINSRRFTKEKGHRGDLKRRFFDETEAVTFPYLIEGRISEIFKRVESTCLPKKMHASINVGVNEGKNQKSIKYSNYASGFKTFVILKQLLSNGVIDKNSCVILDEPESHEHPAWQLLLAELIVLIQKEFMLRIIISTHSPYFLRAIQVYTAKYNTHKSCRYYIAECKGNVATISETTDSIENIYAKLYNPLETLEEDIPDED